MITSGCITTTVLTIGVAAHGLVPGLVPGAEAKAMACTAMEMTLGTGWHHMHRLTSTRFKVDQS